MFRNYIFCVSLGLLFSCTKEVHIPIDYTQSKLVVNGLILLDSTVAVEVSASKFIYESGPLPLIDDATVVLTDASGTEELLTNLGQGLYRSSIIVGVVGQTYFVSVSHPEYTTVTTQTTVPDSCAIDKVVVGEMVTYDYESYKKVSVTFTDPVGEDYYQISVKSGFWNKKIHSGGQPAYIKYDENTGESYPIIPEGWFYEEYSGMIYPNELRDEVYSVDSVYTSYEAWFTVLDPSLDDGYGSTASIYIKDQLFNNQSYTLDLLLETWYISSDNQMFVEVNRISKQYYLYMTSKRMYENSEGPFSQPVQVYSNVDNGHGVLGAKSVSKRFFNVGYIPDNNYDYKY